MAPHTKLIAEALTSAVVGEIADRLFIPDSGLRQWLDEVSQPPEDAEVHARKTYTGVFYVLRNRIRRALVLEHRPDSPSDHQGRRRPESLRPSTMSYPRRHHFEDDDEFPGVG